MPVETGLYELLGISPNASENEIKKSYRLKAKEHHPDKNRDDPSASQKFQEIAAAYEILSDPESRSLYDAAGMAGLTNGFGHDSTDPTDFFSFFEASNLFGFDFATGAPMGGARRKRTKGQDSVIPYEVSLEDMYNGKSVKMDLEKNVVCGTCKGSGAKGNAKPRPCSSCDGKGWTYIQTPLGANRFGTSRTGCHDCDGTGERLREKDRCKKCKGEKTVVEKVRQEIFVEKGMTSGQRIVLAGAGDQEPGLPAGDVIFVLKSQPHSTFERSGNDLLTHATITLSEALLGFSRILITHLDGRGIKITTPPRKVVRPDDTIIVKGEGMPLYKQSDVKGDLYVVFSVEMPDSSWLKRVDQDVLATLLPPKKEEISPQPPVVDEAPFEECDLANVRSRSFPAGRDFFDELDNDEDAWVDESDDEDGPPPECRHQ